MLHSLTDCVPMTLSIIAGLLTAAVLLTTPLETAADDGDPALLSPAPADSVGFPRAESDAEFAKHFASPPPGYGEIPYYWWQGDKLTKERLSWQLDQLRAQGIRGLQINLAHDYKGGGGWLTFPTDPPLLSEEWWKLWRWTVTECGKRGMAIGMSDYTLAWPGNGQWTDEIMADPSLRGSVLQSKAITATGGQQLTEEVPQNALCIMAYPVRAGILDGAAVVDLHSQVKDAKLSWTPPEGSWQVIIVFYQVQPRSIDPMNPKVGRRVVERFFQRFEDQTPGLAGKGLNYFFQDELQFGIGGNLWSQGLPAEFRKRKGYDLIPVLPALFYDLGPQTPKIRLDYADVMAELSEEGYFKPIFNWHWQRGMIYGCDQSSRGLNPREFGDYFRTTRWFTAPGHDTPGIGADLIKGKVSSSIAHLYKRPRVWLEGYHSSGWGTTLAQITRATRENILFGCNLVNLHGLYYTTHGGFWEWAPPDFHFRMPYWAHMDRWLKYFERLSYLASQGHHRCDVAVMYPVAPLEAGLNGDQAVQEAFGLGRELFAHGVDFDFMDFQSLARAQVQGKALHVSDEAYRVLILPGMAALRWSTLQQALAFYREGGVVLATGCLPAASDRAGRDDAQLDAAVREIFGLTAAEAQAGKVAAIHRNAAGGVGAFIASASEPPLRRFDGGFEGRWVWSAETTPKVWFKTVWHGAKGTYAAKLLADNAATLFINGTQVAHTDDYQTGWNGSVELAEGDVITVDGLDTDNGNRTAGLYLALARDGKTVLSAEDLCYAVTPGGADWRTSRDLSSLKHADTHNVHPFHWGGDATGVHEQIRAVISQSISRDFIPAQGAYVQHRKIGARDVYLVMNAPRGTECFFRAKGKVELWDPWTGKTRPLHQFTQTPEGTRLPLPLEASEVNVIVFNPGTPDAAVETTDLDEILTADARSATGLSGAAGAKNATLRQGGKLVQLQGKAPAAPQPQALNGPWEFELKPTLDNHWGDFRLPATDIIIGPEARSFRYAEETADHPGWEAPRLDDSRWQPTTCAFGPHFWLLGPVPQSEDLPALEAVLQAVTRMDPAVPVSVGGREYRWRPYEYSERWGIQEDPGTQGFHGLKEHVSDEFIALGTRKQTPIGTEYTPESGAENAKYYLWTTAIAPRSEPIEALVGGRKPDSVWLNGKESTILTGKESILIGKESILAGRNPLLLRYTGAGRGYFTLRYTSDNDNNQTQYPLAMSWYNRPGILHYDAGTGTAKAGWYRFVSPPGLRAMTITAHGKLRVWADGRELSAQAGTQTPDGAREYRAAIAQSKPEPVIVALRIEHEGGYYAGAALPEPVKLECGAGLLPAGDWSQTGALAAYSGGAWYRRTVHLDAAQTAGRVILDLGEVVATAEVHVNGKLAGVLVSPPWKVDITELAKTGENRIEVLVYSTLANHYSTIPSRYRGAPVAGLLGPVKIETRPVVRLTQR